MAKVVGRKIERGAVLRLSKLMAQNESRAIFLGKASKQCSQEKTFVFIS